jgi:selenocysteine lyase/cysteine desulfurase
MSYKKYFSRFLEAVPGRLHAAAHSHHPWPDVSFDAQQRAWLDAATLMDAKWGYVMGELLPAVQAQLAGHLGLPDPKTLCFGGNTHELVMRLLSSVERRPLRILTTDSEFFSLDRQLRRFEESALAEVRRIAVEPFQGFAERFTAAIAEGGYDALIFSQAFYNSGFVVENMDALVAAVPDDDALVLIDGYQAFMAVPTDLSRIGARAFYVGGGYKYLMSGEGCGFMHCPPGYAPRPVNTGWFAAFDALAGRSDSLPYAADGARFMGATFDPVGLYRLHAVLTWMSELKLDAKAIYTHVKRLQDMLLFGLAEFQLGPGEGTLIPELGLPRGNFLTFRYGLAQQLVQKLAVEQVIVDSRADRLRIGFGIYHDTDDVAELLRRFNHAYPRMRRNPIPPVD